MDLSTPYQTPIVHDVSGGEAFNLLSRARTTENLDFFAASKLGNIKRATVRLHRPCDVSYD